MIVPLAYNHPKGEATQYGLGDMELGVKYRFLHEIETTPQAAVFPIVLLPTGNDKKGLGEGYVQVLLPLWIQKNWGPWTIYGGGGYGIKRLVMNDQTCGMQFLNKQFNRYTSKWEKYSNANDWNTNCGTCHTTGYRILEYDEKFGKHGRTVKDI